MAYEIGAREAKDRLFEALASVARAMASGRRAEIVELLAQGERSVESVARMIDQSVANTSHHLRALAAARLVTSRREGTFVFYRLASPRVGEMWRLIREVATEQLSEIEALAEAYLGDRSQLEIVTREELADRVARGDVVVVDVRPSEEFEMGHVAGAMSIPIDEVSRHLDRIPQGAEVVAYCRGPYCVYADQAVRALQEAGLRSRRLEDGFPEWMAAGFPVERDQQSLSD